MDEIINRVANSSLISLDLTDFYPQGKRVTVDLSQYLFEGLILKEKDFRQALEEIDLSQYKNSHINIICSTDAIVPTWAYMLLSIQLEGTASTVIYGTSLQLEELLWEKAINNLDYDSYTDQRIIIKGCSKYNIPLNIYMRLSENLKKCAKSIMFGEACSTVPLFKQNKK
jgi:hypothetical protein